MQVRGEYDNVKNWQTLWKGPIHLSGCPADEAWFKPVADQRSGAVRGWFRVNGADDYLL